MNYLALAQRIRAEIEAEGVHPKGSDSESGVLQGTSLVEVREEPTGWLFFSHLLDREFWLAVDERTAERLAAEHPGVPVLTLAEIPLLEGKPPDLLREILRVKAVFPDARVRE